MCSRSAAAFASIREHTSAYVSIRQRLACGRLRRRKGRSPSATAYVSIRQHTSAFISMRQHASAYVSIRQHTSATHLLAVAAAKRQKSERSSIRQHTSAYVSIRQHASAYVSDSPAGGCGGEKAPLRRTIAYITPPPQRPQYMRRLPSAPAPAYVSIRQHTSAATIYASPPLSTSACERSNIRRTSSLRPHTLAV
jgi:hypothetical protein